MTGGLKCCLSFVLNTPTVELWLGTRFMQRMKNAAEKKKGCTQEVNREGVLLKEY